MEIVTAGIIALGVGGVATVVGKSGTPVITRPDEWHWPAPQLADGRKPKVSSGWGSPRQGPPVHQHIGMDIMYRRSRQATKAEYAADQGSAWYEVPRGTPCLAARAGKVWSVKSSALGWRIVIDHGKPWATVYQHCENPVVSSVRGTPVRAGEMLATIGHGTRSTIRHIHFELLFEGEPIDCEELMKRWRVLPGPA